MVPQKDVHFLLFQNHLVHSNKLLSDRDVAESAGGQHELVEAHTYTPTLAADLYILQVEVGGITFITGQRQDKLNKLIIKGFQNALSW